MVNFQSEEIIFSLHKGNNNWTEVRVHHFFLRAEEISFLHTKECGNAIPVGNKGISPCSFSINTLKNHRILKKI